MRNLLSLPVAIVVALTFVASTASADPTVEEIVEKTNLASYYAGADGRANVKMEITDGNKNTRERTFTMLRRDVKDGGEQQFYILFHEPADVAKTTFIVHKKVSGDDDRWLYLPALDLEKQIAAADKRTSFVGSDWYYEDVSGRATTEDTHELVETTDKYYVLKNTPKDAGSVEFAHYTMHIHKKTFLPVQVEYVDAKGKVMRKMIVKEVKDRDGYKTVTKAVMEDKRTGSSTTLTFSDVKYDLGLPESIFGTRYLRRAPVKYLRD